MPPSASSKALLALSSPDLNTSGPLLVLAHQKLKASSPVFPSLKEKRELTLPSQLLNWNANAVR